MDQEPRGDCFMKKPEVKKAISKDAEFYAFEKNINLSL
jgi:hypothetical protein